MDGFFDDSVETVSAELNATGLPAGGHTVSVRMRDNTGWGPLATWSLGVSSPVVNFSYQPVQMPGSNGDIPIEVQVQDYASGEYRLKMEYSTDGIKWKKATLSGALVDNSQEFQVGPNWADGGVVYVYLLTWQSAVDIPNQEHASVAIRLTADLGGGRTAGIVSSSFAVDNLAPPVPALITPPNGYETKDTTPLFVWQSVETGVTYRLQVDNQADFSSPEINTDTLNDFFVPALSLTPRHYF